MEKLEAEKIIKDTIEYANKEIKKNKRKAMKTLWGLIIAAVILLLAYVLVFVYETPVKYKPEIVEVKIPEGEGIDITVKLPNYKRAKAVLVQIDDNSYDLYINITQTLASKIFKDSDLQNNLLRVGNGMIVDYQSERLQEHIPNGNDYKAIKHVYYINDLSAKIAAMDDKALVSYQDKTLIWENYN